MQQFLWLLLFGTTQNIVFRLPDPLFWFWKVQFFTVCMACIGSACRNKNNNFLHCFQPPHLPTRAFTQRHLKQVLVCLGLVGYHIVSFFKLIDELTDCSYFFFCLVIFLFNQTKDNAVLKPRTGHFWGLEGFEANAKDLSFEAKAKDFKKCPRGQRRYLGLHLCSVLMSKKVTCCIRPAALLSSFCLLIIID